MIAHDAGEEGAIVLAKVREAKDDSYGYDAVIDTYADLMQTA